MATGLTISPAEVEKRTNVKERTQRNIKKRAFERGFRPDIDPRILECYVIDGERPGRPKEISEEVEEGLLANVRNDRAGRSKSSEVLAYEANISNSSALRILHKHGFHSVKPTTKCGLTPAMLRARLAECPARTVSFSCLSRVCTAEGYAGSPVGGPATSLRRLWGPRATSNKCARP